MESIDRPAAMFNVGEQRTYAVGGPVEFVTIVEPYECIPMRTLDASGGQIGVNTHWRDIDESALFPVNGPVGVSGVKAGDAVGIEIVSLVPTSPGHCWTRPGLGLSPDPAYRVLCVDLERAVLELDGGVTVDVPAHPHVGTLGVWPLDPHTPRDLGAYGGNLDTAHLGHGSTLWVASQIAGAGIFVGDVHNSIGDAEVGGTGVEVGAMVTLRMHVRSGWSPPVPIVATSERVWAIGIGATVEGALRSAVAFVTSALEAGLAIPHDDAYVLASQLLEVEICQVVNPKVSVAVSVREGLDTLLISSSSDSSDGVSPSQN
jgi:amidase